ncbi:MAG: amino acid ABC transporter permease [Candidatus Bipolaricaulota bacterium]|nr:amino acid ABC transporter permease [Candidatus Bipolaricaulota bacterium]
MMGEKEHSGHPYGNELPPPIERIPFLRWLKENLFSSWFNAILTVLFTALVVVGVFGFGKWALGARWEVIPANLKLLLVGTYPVESLWRIWTTIYLISFLLGSAGGSRGGLMRHISMTIALTSVVLAIIPFEWATRGWIIGIAGSVGFGFLLGHFAKGFRRYKHIEIGLWILSLPVTLLLVNGIPGILPVVEGRNSWGLMLNVISALVGIALSFPIGILLALGRRSKLPAIRLVCTAYIEVIRGVPLITLLFMASIMLQLLLPANVRPDLLIRAMITITAFEAAYMAENVRGGLQAIAKGQYEAASAVGLNKFLTTTLIIMPQALRLVIPAIVGQFISLFMDTTLFGFIAILELLHISRSVMGNIEWRGTIFELYVFIGVVFWILCYSMSYVSRSIEKTLGVGER